MKYLITIGAIILTNFFITAQSEFKEGYIIKNNKDTIYGFLDYKRNTVNAKKCIFRTDINSENQIFSPEDINSYRFKNSKFYISKSLKIEGKTKQLFLEYLINGIVDVFYYRDNDGEHYLIDDGSGNLYELKNEEKEVILERTTYIRETKEYIGLLKNIFKESPTVMKRVENIELNHKSLIKITNDFHNEVCSDQACIIYEKRLPKSKRGFGLIIRLNGNLFSQTREFIDELYYLENSKFGFNVYPTVGVFYKKGMPYINERLFIQYEGTYSLVNFSTSNSYFEPVLDMNYLNDIKFKQNIFGNTFMLKYEYPKGKIRPIYHTGVFLDYYFNTEFQRDLKVLFSWGDTYFEGQSKESPFMKLNYGINVGAGLTFNYWNKKELFLDLRYQRGFGFIQGFHTNNLSLNMGIQFGK